MAWIMMKPETSLFLSVVAILSNSLHPMPTNTKHFSFVKDITEHSH